MKILFNIDTMNKGGAERVIANLSNYLVTQNNNVSILTLLKGESTYSLNPEVEFFSLEISEKNKNIFQKIYHFFKNIKKYNIYLKKYKPDIVISFLPRASYYSIIACRLNNIKLIVSERNDPNSVYNKLSKKMLTKFLYSKANGFVFQTKDASKFFNKKMQKKSVIIPNPVNDKFYVERYKGKRKNIIVSIGRLDNQKNQMLLIDAFKKVSEKYEDYELIIYGEGPLRNVLEQKIKEYKLEKKVKLPGIENNIIDKIYDARMFILCSDYEGMPNALMEALTLGIPCISTDCPAGGPRTLIENDFNGKLIKTNDKKELTNAICELIKDDSKCEFFSKNASESMKPYKVNLINEKWEKYIKSVTSYQKEKLFDKIIKKIIYLMGINVIKIPDKYYLKFKYKYMMGKKLDLKNPKTYNEKLQWLKLYDRNHEYVKMVDKATAKEYVANIIGDEYIIPTIGIYNYFDEIDFSKLPNQFVMKCTHDSGGLVICKDKNKLNISEARKKIEKCLNTNYYYSGREWPYKEIKPRIIIEKYMEDKLEKDLKDYKFFCFNGKPELLFIAVDRPHDTKFNFYNIDFKKLPFKQHYENFERNVDKPKNFNKMVELSKKLSKNIPHVRVDFYEINGKVYFGELTFYHFSGFEKFEPEEWDYKLGDLINLGVKDNEK